MIIAIKEQDGFKIGLSVADMNANMDDHDLTLPDNVPFWKVKGETGCYVGLSKGDFAADVLRACPELFRGLKDMKDIVGRLPAIREALMEYDLVNDEEYWDNDIVLVLGDHAYVINCYFIINEITDYEPMFSRLSYMAMSVLDATEGEMAEQRILKATRHYDAMRKLNHFPIVIYNTKTGKRKIYKEYPKH